MLLVVLVVTFFVLLFVDWCNAGFVSLWCFVILWVSGFLGLFGFWVSGVPWFVCCVLMFWGSVIMCLFLCFRLLRFDTLGFWWFYGALNFWFCVFGFPDFGVSDS